MLKHQFFDFLRLIGMRDRLRCPACKGVGCWKPHGGWLDREDERKVRRWMCKWCGFYRGPEGAGVNQVTLGKTCWELLDRYKYYYGQVEIKTPEIMCDGAFPWRG